MKGYIAARAPPIIGCFPVMMARVGAVWGQGIRLEFGGGRWSCVWTSATHSSWILSPVYCTTASLFTALPARRQLQNICEVSSGHTQCGLPVYLLGRLPVPSLHPASLSSANPSTYSTWPSKGGQWELVFSCAVPSPSKSLTSVPLFKHWQSYMAAQAAPKEKFTQISPSEWFPNVQLETNACAHTLSTEETV